MIANSLAAFVMGLAGSGHCAAMCGGLVVASRVTRPGRTLPLVDRSRGVVLAAQHAGRLAAYAVAGGLAGTVGQLAGGVAAAGRLTLQVGAAVVLLVAGAALAGVLPPSASPERLGEPLWRRLAPLAVRARSGRGVGRGLAFGVIWGFLPCGLVYSALSLAAVSGSWREGAITLAAFGLGTLPALLSVTMLAGALRSAAGTPGARRAAGALIMVLGVAQSLVIAISAVGV